MLNILVNALSVTNQSGAYVLGGHLAQLIPRLEGLGRFYLVCRKEQHFLSTGLASRVHVVQAPEETADWAHRAWWEYRNLASISNTHRAGAYFTPSGIAAAGLPVPQVVFCQNPWALVADARRPLDALKAWLQRRAYRSAMRNADVMIFNSAYMQQAYRINAGALEKRGVIAYQAIDEETHDRARRMVSCVRRASQLLCVSVMGPHKNIEILIRALAILRREGREDLHLVLAGSWPDSAYRKKIEQLIRRHRLDLHVKIMGFLDRDELDRHYAESALFCLISRCESFGIPAIEAQVFGTPVVGASRCAVPEICGDGGLYVDPDDVDGAVKAIRGLLDDKAEWRRRSHASRVNAGRFRWQSCSTPLVDLFAEMAGA